MWLHACIPCFMSIRLIVCWNMHYTRNTMFRVGMLIYYVLLPLNSAFVQLHHNPIFHACYFLQPLSSKDVKIGHYLASMPSDKWFPLFDGLDIVCFYMFIVGMCFHAMHYQIGFLPWIRVCDWFLRLPLMLCEFLASSH